MFSSLDISKVYLTLKKNVWSLKYLLLEMDKAYNFSAPSVVYMCIRPPFACKTTHTQSGMTTTKPVKFSSGV